MPLLRRDFVGLIGGMVAAPVVTNPAMAAPAAATVDPAAAPASQPSAYDFAFDRPGGGRIALESYRGRPILIVNTATNCGFAGQFATLELLWQRYSRRGLMLLAVPSNDFGGQEPLDGQAIADSAKSNYGATYMFAEKTKLRGPSAHPFYRWAALRKPGQVPSWNFHKYLVGRDGDLVGGFATATDPIGPELVQAIGRELATG
jgi:glutathione peroxidase